MTSFAERFSRQATATPGAIAVECNGTALTYAELHRTAPSERSNRLIPVTVERTLCLLPKLLSVWKAGGAYVPIDPEYPAERQQFMRDDAAGDSPANGVAYVIYTSGSTGKPKGVAVSHLSMLNLLDDVSRRIEFTADDTLLAVTTAGFDISVLELWMPLLCGGRVVIATRDEVLDPTRLRRLAESCGATVMQATPAGWTMLLDSGWQPPSGFRILVGGEVLPVELARRLASLGCAVWNMYGPTETTIWSTMAVVNQGPVTIGRPLANTRLYVLDAYGEAVPVGVPGELYIAGAGVAEGYWNRPELTEERFVMLGGNERAYRTGDLVSFRDDGQLSFIGRVDGQVKLHGFRIELGEIEAALESLTQGAATAIRGDSLCAWYTGHAIPEAELRSRLSQTLPPYMVPSRFVHLEKLPLTVNGKLDRGALPLPPEIALLPSLPVSVTEELLQTIFAALLHVNSVGPNDNFFHLGGHSLLATGLVTRVRNAFRTELCVRAVFDAPTPRLLARAIARERTSEPLPPIERPPESHGVCLSFAQGRLLFLDRYYGGANAMYNIAESFRICGPLDRDRLLDAFSKLTERHSALRTRFRDDAAMIDPPRGLAWNDAAVTAPFDLAGEWPIRVSLTSDGPENHTLSLAVHHLAADGWSLGVIHREIALLYNGHQLPPLAIQYSDYAAWQRRVMAGELLEREASWWQSQLEGAPPLLDLPADRPRPAEQRFEAGNHFFTLPADVTHSIRSFTRSDDATLFMVLLTAFQILLARYTGSDDIVVGTPIANRNSVETEALIGFFANTLTLRTKFHGEPSFRQAVQRVREVSLDAAAHQDLPFEKLVEAISPTRTGAYTPVFQVLFMLLNTAGEELNLPDLAIERCPVPFNYARYDLSFEAEEQNGELRCLFNYSAALFDSVRMERMAGHLIELLRGALTNPETSIWQLPFLTEQERAQFVEWNATATPARPSFWERISQHPPSKIAIECEGKSLTYSDLVRVAPADRPNQLIPVVVERTIDLLPELLSIWKADSAYVPIDPDYPAERQQFMLEDVAGDSPANGLAYVIYTSGSTGKPKGVAIHQHSLLNLLEAMRTAVPVDEHDVMIALATASFDMSVPELWLPLYCGAKLILGTREDARDPVRLRRLLETSGATVMQATPTLWAALLDQGWKPAPGFKLLVGAEELPQTVAERLAKLPCTVWNMFGPTETTVWSTMGRVNPGPVSIGKPLANTRLFVLDPQGEQLPLGIAGELYIAGAGVASGYWNRPDLTADRFVTLRNGERAYRTGDQVRYREDGELEFLRRLDTQVKLRGFRIELGEVETALAQHPRVMQTAAAIRGDSLFAWYTGDVVPEAELRSLLLETLPAYMAPARFFAIDRLPLNVHGKLDRSALAVPNTAPVIQEESADPLERQLLPIWREVLGNADFSATDSFFDFGGHSLSAMRLVTQIETATGQPLPVYMLFSAPRIRDVVRYLRRNAPAQLPAGLTPVQAQGSRPPIFFFNVRAGCWNLAHAMGLDQPVLGVEPGGDDPASSIRAVSPSGPYLLAAFEVGAQSAFDIAAKLGATLALIDGAVPKVQSRWSRIFSKVEISPSDIRILYFRSPGKADPRPGWNQHVQHPIELIDLPGPAFESPAVELIAQCLKSV